jgi:hypothetical protein
MADIEKVRSELAAEFSRLEAEGRNWPHTTGDIFMTRLLRGNNNSVAESVKWYKKFLEMREKYHLDDVHRRCEAEGTRWKASMMPHSEEILKYFTTSFDEDELVTPTGHLLWFDAWGDSRIKQAFAAGITEEQVEAFFMTLFELRCSALDRISREKGRLVKIVRIMDFEGVSIAAQDKTFSKIQKEKLDPVMVGTSIEVVKYVVITNFPGWARGLFEVIKKALPERLVKRFRVTGADYLQNPELNAEVGAALINRMMSTRTRLVKDTSMEGTDRVIKPGDVLERVLEVSPGCQVLWTFKLGSAAQEAGLLSKALDATAGEATDLLFSVKFIPEIDISASRSTNVEDYIVDVVPPTSCESDQGQLDGKTVVDRPGMMVVCWSNQASWVRPRVLASFAVKVNRPEDDVGSFHSGDD